LKGVSNTIDAQPIEVLGTARNPIRKRPANCSGQPIALTKFTVSKLGTYIMTDRATYSLTAVLAIAFLVLPITAYIKSVQLDQQLQQLEKTITKN
jgi:hypothetical protein